MNEERWAAFDRYITDLFIAPDPVLDAALDSSERAGLPAIGVTAAQGRLLHILARVQGARRILEIGTLGGYSTIWLARALPPGGTMLTLELDPRHAEVARANLERAGLSDRVSIRMGRAAESLARLAEEGGEPFDLFFLDADKPGNAGYFRWALRLSRPGSLIIVDNVVRGGAVLDDDGDPASQGTRLLNEVMAAEPRVSVTQIQTVGAKGWDGFALALVLDA